MGDCITHPVDSDKVHGIKGFQIEGLVIIIHVKIGFCAVVEVAYVVDRNEVVLNCGIGKNSHVRLPVTVIGRFYVEPPCHDQAEDYQKTYHSPKPLFEQKKCGSCAGSKTDSYGGTNALAGEI